MHLFLLWFSRKSRRSERYITICSTCMWLGDMWGTLASFFEAPFSRNPLSSSSSSTSTEPQFAVSQQVVQKFYSSDPIYHCFDSLAQTSHLAHVCVCVVCSFAILGVIVTPSHPHDIHTCYRSSVLPGRYYFVYTCFLVQRSPAMAYSEGGLWVSTFDEAGNRCW